MKTIKQETLKSPEINEKLQIFALERADRYRHLEISCLTITTPYFQNYFEAEWAQLEREAGVTSEQIQQIHKSYDDRQTNFGWGRGKGTPEEIEDYARKLLETRHASIHPGQEEGLYFFMHMVGLGVDCSGYVYEILRYAFEHAGLAELDFIDEEAWDDPNKRGSMRAAARVFGKSSHEIKPNELRNLDIILLKSSTGNYIHIAIVLKQEERFVMAQSSVTGVRFDDFEIIDNLPIFHGQRPIGPTWEELYENGSLELRRLNVFRDSDEK